MLLLLLCPNEIETYILTIILGICTYGVETSESIMYLGPWMFFISSTQTNCEIHLYKKVKTSMKSIKRLYEFLGGKILSM